MSGNQITGSLILLGGVALLFGVDRSLRNRRIGTALFAMVVGGAGLLALAIAAIDAEGPRRLWADCEACIMYIPVGTVYVVGGGIGAITGLLTALFGSVSDDSDTD